MRELSAKLAEGEILNGQIYMFTYTAKIAVRRFLAEDEGFDLIIVSIPSSRDRARLHRSLAFD